MSCGLCQRSQEKAWRTIGNWKLSLNINPIGVGVIWFNDWVNIEKLLSGRIPNWNVRKSWRKEGSETVDRMTYNVEQFNKIYIFILRTWFIRRGWERSRSGCTRGRRGWRWRCRRWRCWWPSTARTAHHGENPPQRPPDQAPGRPPSW